MKQLRNVASHPNKLLKYSGDAYSFDNFLYGAHYFFVMLGSESEAFRVYDMTSKLQIIVRDEFDKLLQIDVVPNLQERPRGRFAHIIRGIFRPNTLDMPITYDEYCEKRRELAGQHWKKFTRHEKQTINLMMNWVHMKKKSK